MRKNKASNTSKLKSLLDDFSGKFVQNPNNKLYCNLCNCVVSCTKRFLIDSHWKSLKHQKALDRSEVQMPRTSQTVLRSNDSNFVEKVTKSFLPAPISLRKLNNKHVKNLFTESTCRKAVLKLGSDE